LECETQDIRSEITKETDQISQSTSSYGESYYNQDTSYDYGAYGYPATSTDSTTSGAEAATADTPETTSGEGSASSEAAVSTTPAPSTEVASGPEPGSHPANSDVAPVVAAAQGTVPTHLAPALPPHAAESATRDDV